MKVTLSIRTKIVPPLTVPRARLVARMILPQEKRVLVSGGNKTYLTFKSFDAIKLSPPTYNEGLMRVRLAVERKIALQDLLTEYRARQLVEGLATKEDVIRIEGGKYTYLSVLENGGRTMYKLGKCRCGRDTLSSDEYCKRCLPGALGSDKYYSLSSCIEMIAGMARRAILDGKGGDVEGLIRCIQG